MWKSVVVVAAVLVLAAASAVSATHGEDIIPDPVPSSDAEFALELIADGFTTPVWGINAPGNNTKLYVVDQVGTITAVDTEPGNDGGVLDFLDVGAPGLDLLVPLGAFGPGSFDERGLLGLAFHPDYSQNGLLYTYTSEPIGPVADFSTMPDGEAANSQSVIREWQVENPQEEGSVVDPASTRVLIRIDEPQFNHDGGAIVFGPDDLLYIAVGDGGNRDDEGPGHAEGGNGQDLSDGNVLGKILRISPLGDDSANGEYGVPANNPFVGGQGADEIYAYGFRNPFRISFDSETGDLYAADVGQGDVEEVDIVVNGGNYGWPVKEGTFLFDRNGDEDGFASVDSPGVPAGLIDPIAQYDHDEGVSVTGGFVYRGNLVSDLRGTYVFGDFTTSFDAPLGRMFHIDGGGEVQALEPTGRDAVGMFVTGFGQDQEGELYVMGTQNVAPGDPFGTSGQVFKIVSVDAAPIDTLSVEELVLVNADKNAFNLDDPADLFVLEDGAILGLGNLPANLNIRALTKPDIVGSVVFSLDGAEVGFRSDSRRAVENFPPYSAGGDSPIGGYLNLALTPGQHTIEATPYTQQEAEGQAGVTLSVTFTVGDGGADPLAQAVEAIGGADALNGLERFEITATGTRWTLDEGMVPGDGATMPGPYTLELAYDVANERFRLDYDLVSFGFVERIISEIVDGDAGYLIGQDANFGPPVSGAMLSDRLESTRLHQLMMNPQLLIRRLLTGELSAEDTDGVTIDGRGQDVLEIERDGAAPLFVFLDHETHLVTQVSTLENDPLRRDVPLVVTYDGWTEADSGVLAPMLVKVSYDGELVQDESRTAVSVNGDLDAGLFDPPAGASPAFDAFLANRGIVSHQHLQSFAALGFPRDGVQLQVTATELAPGVHHLTGGSHNSLLVEQGDGLVLVDSPLDEFRAQALLDFIESTFSGMSVTHIVQSHHHADHSAGVRTIVAAGATLVVEESAADFWAIVLDAPSTLVPDALAAIGGGGNIEPVASGGSSTIGSGSNAVGVHSFNQPHAQDSVFVVAGGVGFIVDIFNPAPEAPIPQPLLDLIADKDLTVTIISGGHGGFVPFESPG